MTGTSLHPQGRASSRQGWGWTKGILVPLLFPLPPEEGRLTALAIWKLGFEICLGFVIWDLEFK
jgi:hypothetical protein